ncbi:MAG: sigma-70 family RNA polymerase sigma factor [bacterium]|nr:sigma-70 family RNA polymerase sigma factor [bacterium]
MDGDGKGLARTRVRPYPNDMTDLLRACSRGDHEAAEKLMTPLIYGELRRMAAARLRAERLDHTLQPTELVNEAYLRIFDRADILWMNRAQFFAIAANMMRRILVDQARKRRRKKRGAGIIRVDLGRAADLPCRRTPDIVALDDALNDLAAMDPRKAAIVELHFFGGLSVAETAEVLSCSTATVTRHWRMAKAWLGRELGEDHQRDA